MAEFREDSNHHENLRLQYNFRSFCNSTLILKGWKRKSHDNLVSFIKLQYQIFSSALVFSLLTGATFLPFQVKAESTDTCLTPIVSFQAVTQEKTTTDNAVDTTKDVQTASDSCLVPTNVSNLEATGGVSSENEGISSDQISVYVIRKGDSISQIADMYGVSANTILWANGMKKGDKLVEGDTLIILPMDGVNHIVVKGNTLKGIAEKYKVDIADIIAVNDISIDTQLSAGQELIIPDAEMSVPSVSQPSKGTTSYVKPGLQNISGYFINPVPNYKRKSQGIHGKNGVDLAAPTGTKIVAAAAGKVLIARMGYNGGYGNMVIIQHPNGTQTLYAHQNSLAVKTGESVKQGEVIGYVGSTGHSTGPHLHYEVRGATNNAKNL